MTPDEWRETMAAIAQSTEQYWINHRGGSPVFQGLMSTDEILSGLGSERFSECVVHDDGDTVRLEWTRFGLDGVTKVADLLVEEWVAAENDRRALGREVARLRAAIHEHRDNRKFGANRKLWEAVS